MIQHQASINESPTLARLHQEHRDRQKASQCKTLLDSPKPPPRLVQIGCEKNKYELPIGPMRNFNTILNHVILMRGVSKETFFSRSRTRIIAAARGYFYWLCRTVLDKTLHAIGRYVGRDHTTVINGIVRYCVETGARYPSASGKLPRNKSNYEMTIYATKNAIAVADLIKAGKTPLEVAAILGISRALVYHRVAYAVKKGLLPRRLSSVRYGLTDKQERFVHEYMKHGNRIKAFKAVYSLHNLGPVNLGKRVDEVMGCQVVKEKIAELRKSAETQKSQRQIDG